MTRQLWVALIAACVVPWLVAVVSAAPRPARQRGEFKVVEFSSAYFVVMGLCGTLFLALAALAWTHPGRTDPAVLPRVIATFLGFAGLSLVGLGVARRSEVLWNTQEVEGADTWGRRQRLAWDQLARVEYVPAATALRLISHDGRRVWVSPQMRGYQEFVGELERRGLPVSS